MYGSPTLSPPNYAAPPVAADPPPVGQPALSFNPLALPSRDVPARSFVIERQAQGWAVVFLEGLAEAGRDLFGPSDDDYRAAFEAGSDWVYSMGERSC